MNEQREIVDALSRLQSIAHTWPGVVSITLHGSARKQSVSTAASRYHDIDILILFEDEALSEGIAFVDEFFAALTSSSEGIATHLYRLQSGPMHPLRADIKNEPLVSLLIRPVVFWHISVFTFSSYQQADAPGSPSPLLVHTWQECTPLIGKSLGDLRKVTLTANDVLTAGLGIQDCLDMLHSGERGYWTWESAGDKSWISIWRRTAWEDFESYELPLYFARWALIHTMAVASTRLPGLRTNPRTLIEKLAGHDLVNELAEVEWWATHREQMRVAYSDDPVAFQQERDSTSLITSTQALLEAAKRSLIFLSGEPEQSWDVNLNGHTTSIRETAHIGTDIADLVDRLRPDTVIVLIDAEFATLVDATAVIRKFGHRLRAEIVEIPGGRQSKTVDVLVRQLDLAEEIGVNRSSLYVIIGGGTIGNLGGMVAGLVCRGVRFVHVPTTLVAQLDSAIGMKQSVNGRTTKNYLGLFHAPCYVLIEPLCLATLTDADLVSGLVEALKHGVCQDVDLERQTTEMLEATAISVPSLVTIIRRTVSLKLNCLERDPQEMNGVQFLELGHKVGHAIEHLASGHLPHGYAVAIGMIAEARYAAELGLVPDSSQRYISERLKSLRNRGVSCPKIDPRVVAEQMQRDNHRDGNKITISVLRAPQEPIPIQVELSPETLARLADATDSALRYLWT